MDICYVYCSPVPESSGHFYALPVARMVKMFRDTEHTVHIVAFGPLDTAILEENGAVCHVYDCRFRWLGALGFYTQLFWSVTKLSRSNDYDIFSNVWAHYNLLPIVLASSLSGGRVYARIFGLGNLWDRERADESLLQTSVQSMVLIAVSRILNQLEVRILNLVDGIYVNAYTVRKMLVDRGIRDDPITVITQGVDTEFFSPDRCSPGRPTVLFVGRLASESKQFEDALTVFERVQKRVPDARFEVVGDGDLPPDLAARINRNDAIEVRGYLDRHDLRESYRTASVLLLTSVKEGVPNVVLEGFACGLPIVATPAGDVERVVTESNGGKVVSDRDLDMAAELTSEILTDTDYQSELGRRGREYVLSEHALPVAREKYESLFKS